MTPHDRAALVLAEAWRLLPPLKYEAPLVDIVLEDMGALHGTYTPDTGVLRLSRHLFTADPLGTRRLIDLHGDDPARIEPCVYRDVHTTIHELAHAIGAGTGLDESPGWLALGGWVLTPEDIVGTARYWELRTGWEPGPSPWRHRVGMWFGRDYSRKSPQEAFADGVAALCLGWDRAYGPAAQPQVQWLRRHVWQETGVHALAASTARWRTSLDAHIDAALSPTQRQARRLGTTTRAVTSAVTDVLQAWRATWTATLPGLTIPHGVGWLPVAPLADEVFTAVRPAMTRLWQSATATRAPVPPELLAQRVVTFARTAQRRLATLVAPVQSHGPQAIAEAVDVAYADALTRRLPLLVESLTRQVTNAASRAVALRDGATQATWRTTSGHPCAWCAELEGQVFAVTSTPLWEQGETLVSGAGQEMALDYEAIFHPPIHVHCACELVYF